MPKKIVALTLMRSGSKRFPNKNMYKVAGKELYKYTSEFAQRLGYKYYLASDYDEIEKVKGINYIRREAQYVTDEHKTCREIKSFELDADIYILLQVTSPLRNMEAIKLYIKHFVAGDYEAGFCAYRVDDGYYYTHKRKLSRVNFKQEKRTDNGCYKHPLFKETGGFYIFKKCMLDRKHILDTQNIVMYEDTYNLDIDRPEQVFDFYREIRKGIT